MLHKPSWGCNFDKTTGNNLLERPRTSWSFLVLNPFTSSIRHGFCGPYQNTQIPNCQNWLFSTFCIIRVLGCYSYAKAWLKIFCWFVCSVWTLGCTHRKSKFVLSKSFMSKSQICGTSALLTWRRQKVYYYFLFSPLFTAPLPKCTA